MFTFQMRQLTREKVSDSGRRLRLGGWCDTMEMSYLDVGAYAHKDTKEMNKEIWGSILVNTADEENGWGNL